MRSEKLTDHAAVSVEFRLQQPAVQEDLAAAAAVPCHAAPASMPSEKGTGAPAPSAQPEVVKGTELLRQDVAVITVANTVTEAVRGFLSVASGCLDFDKCPATTALCKDDPVVDWKTLPAVCGFKVQRPGGRGHQHEASATERRDMSVVYTKFSKWAATCGYDDASLRDFFRQQANPQTTRRCADMPAGKEKARQHPRHSAPSAVR